MKKILCALLAVLLLTAVLASCASGPAENGTVPVTEAATTAATAESGTAAPAQETEEPRLSPDISGTDLKGLVLHVLTRGTSSSTWYSRDIYSEGITGDIIGDAVYKRNANMEAEYGFTVKETGSKAPLDDARTAVASGDDVYGMFCFKVKDDITALLLQGCLTDLNKVSVMNLDAPYYDQNSRSAFSFDHRLFLVTGDLLTMDNDATRCTLFNKDLFAELNLSETMGGSLYERMEAGKWTLEAMEECAKAATWDLNGDLSMGLDDRWGMVSEQFNVLAFCNAAGILLYEKDSDDILYFTGSNERALTVLSDVITMLNGAYCRHYSNGYNEAIPQFSEGIVLFYPAQLADVPLLRNMECDFGIVPLPKYTEEQDGYHSPVTTYGCNCISIPTSVADTERVAAAIEVLSCESMYTVTPAYYELNLKYKLARDLESSRSMDIILSTACFEPAYMWNLGGVYSAICNAFNNNTPNLTAAFRSAEKVSKNTIKTNLETIRAKCG